MIPYLILVFIVVISYYIMKRNFKNYKKKYCIFMGIILFLMLAFRDTSMGVDLQGLYIPYFNIIKNLSFAETIQFTQNQQTEVLFYLLNKVISLFSKNIHFYLAIMSIPYVLVVSRFIYKYSKNPLLGYLIFLSLNYYCFSFSALRHTLAASALVFSYDYLKQKRAMPFILCVLLATLFHRTALVFLIAYPVIHFKISWKQTFIMLLILLCSTLLREFLFTFIFSVFDSGHFSNYVSIGKSMSLVFFVINFLLYIFMLYVFREKKNEPENRILLNIQFLCICFAALTPVLGEMIRISFYFGVFLCASLPNAIEYSKYKINKRVYYSVLGLCFILYFLNFTVYNSSLVPYVSIFN